MPDPVWKGPLIDGVTQSLLGKWLSCRERFRVLTIEGLQPAPAFSKSLEYGNLWHSALEAVHKVDDWHKKLGSQRDSLMRKYPMDRIEVQKWFRVAHCQFPVYLEFYEGRTQGERLKTLSAEKVFSFQYNLPSTRKVRLRGKFDSVLEGVPAEGYEEGVWLRENKTSAELNTYNVERRLRFDLQTMLYLTVLRAEYGDRVKGVVYDVVRRPLSGGTGSIRQKQPTKASPTGESDDEFYSRLMCEIREKADTFFGRWVVPVSSQDITKFLSTSLEPILAQLCWWYDQVAGYAHPFDLEAPPMNYRMPFGVYNELDAQGCTLLDEYLESGSEAGLVRVQDFFPELSE